MQSFVPIASNCFPTMTLPAVPGGEAIYSIQCSYVSSLRVEHFAHGPMSVHARWASTAVAAGGKHTLEEQTGWSRGTRYKVQSIN